MKILVLNSGSGTQKACLYEIGPSLPDHPPDCQWQGRVEFDGDTAVISVESSHRASRQEAVPGASREQVLRRLLGTLTDERSRVLASLSEIDAVGHRVVHGGPYFEEPVRITTEVRAAIAGVSELAPLHTAAALEGMHLVDRILAGVPQVAVFDTGFHRRIPSEAAIYPGPYDWATSGIRRYGFHGINHQYCARRAAQLLSRDLSSLRLVTCHLGNGCSLAAIRGGRSIDTTMGFTPLDGLMMGTRSGSVDPGILIYLMRQHRLDGDQLDQMLNQKSGLLGISGFSNDMRKILVAMGQGHERAHLAFDIFIHRLRTAIGGMAAVLGGIDSLVFTAGIGENSAAVRTAACSTLGFLGIRLDSELNARPTLDADISHPDSPVRVLVIQAEEDWVIATECWKLVCANTGHG
jgi:acetate kinase